MSSSSATHTSTTSSTTSHTTGSTSSTDPAQTDSTQHSGGVMQNIKNAIFGSGHKDDASQAGTHSATHTGTHGAHHSGTSGSTTTGPSGSTTTTTTTAAPGTAGLTHTTGVDATGQPKDIYLQGIKTVDPSEPNVLRTSQQKATEAAIAASNSANNSSSSGSMSSSSSSSSTSGSSSSTTSHSHSSTTSTTHPSTTSASGHGAHHNDSGVTGMAAGSGASSINNQPFKHDEMNFDGKDLNAGNRPTGIRPVGASGTSTHAAPSQ